MATAPVIERTASSDIMLAVEETPQIVLLDSAKFDQFYERVKAETAGIVVDLSTKKGRDEVRSMAAKVTRSKTMIDKAGLALTKQWRDQTNQVNAARKDIEHRLDALADEVRRPLTEWEDAEKARNARADELIASFRAGAVVTLDDTAAGVRERGKKAWEVIVSEESLGDRLAEVQAAKDHCVETLQAALARLTREEAERAELEKLRAEAAERERAEQERLAAEEERARQEAEAAAAEERRIAADKAEAERVERIAREAEERARREAEEAAQAERDRIQREHEEALAAERRRAEQAEADAQAERDRIARAAAEAEAQAKAEAAEQARREKNRAHRAQVMGEAKLSIMAAGKVDEAAAIAIVKAIVAGSVPHVSLEF